MNIGKHRALRTGITAEIRMIRINGADTYMCKINGKIYKMSSDEFKKKWGPIPGKELKQEVIECLNRKTHSPHE